MAIQVTMPKLGLTMIQGKVVKWLVAEGSPVTKGQTIVQVTTEKIANVVEAPADGVLRKILVAEGRTVPVLTPLAIIAGADEDISEAIKAASRAPSISTVVAGAAVAAAPMAAPAPASAEPLKVSPVARKLAEDAGLDLATVTGSGPGGRILREDVERALAARAAVAGPAVAAQAAGTTAASPATTAAAPPAGPIKASPAARRLAEEKGLDLSQIKGTGPEGRILTEDVERALAARAAAVAAVTDQSITIADQSIPADDMRLTISRRMMESMSGTAQTTISRTINAGELVRMREALLPRIERESGVRLTYTDLVVRAVALALRKHPEINVTFDGRTVTRLAEINIGVAVDLGEGLIVPVVRHADALGLAQLSARIKTLAEMARRGALEPDDIVGGTFTVTNLGMYGADAFTPILNPPESAILGVGRIVDRPVVENGRVVPGKEMVLSLTHDHRVIDGAPAARFLGTVADHLEAPYTILGLGNAL